MLANTMNVARERIAMIPTIYVRYTTIARALGQHVRKLWLGSVEILSRHGKVSSRTTLSLWVTKERSHSLGERRLLP